MKLSIIVPVYNSDKIIFTLHERIIKSVKKMNLENNFEILMINDHSPDSSWDKIKNLTQEYNYVKGINLSRNFGQHAALMAGLNYCTGEKIITLDDDLQHPPEFFFNVLEKLEKFDVCYTYYYNRQHIKWKRVVSSLNNIISSFLLNKPFYIYMSSFRGLNKNVVNEIVNFKKSNVYLDSLILKATNKIGMITVEHFAREKGESNYTFKKLLILWSNMVLNFSFYPFRFSSIFGYILKFIITLFRKKNKEPQYEIVEKTFK